jgi:hypothetical protein
MAEDKDNEKNAHAQSKERMQQGIPNIKECGSVKGRDVGAVENEDSRRGGEEPASP